MRNVHSGGPIIGMGDQSGVNANVDDWHVASASSPARRKTGSAAENLRLLASSGGFQQEGKAETEEDDSTWINAGI